MEATADDAMVEALAAKDNPALRKREAAARSEGRREGRREGEAKGKAEGMTTSILSFLETRGIAVSPEQREEILSCADLDRLKLWVSRAALAASAEEVLQG